MSDIEILSFCVQTFTHQRNGSFKSCENIAYEDLLNGELLLSYISFTLTCDDYLRYAVSSPEFEANLCVPGKQVSNNSKGVSEIQRFLRIGVGHSRHNLVFTFFHPMLIYDPRSCAKDMPRSPGSSGLLPVVSNRRFSMTT